MGIATDLILLVVTAFFSGVVMQKLGQPLVLGYILTGIAFSPLSLIHISEPTRPY